MRSWSEHAVDAWRTTDMSRDEVKLSFLIVWLILSIGMLFVLVAPFALSADTIAALVPTCEWKVKYGRECSLCGMTTSFIQISHGNFKQSLLSNRASIPLYVVFVINELFGLPFLFNRLRRIGDAASRIKIPLFKQRSTHS
ncbi:MAG: DUF2752 domain-containing protein [candidate division WOR-3 bacterium]